MNKEEILSEMKLLENKSRISYVGKLSCEFLINNTRALTFNPETMKGYQRATNDKHVDNIVKFLMSKFFDPMSIICAMGSNEEEENEDEKFLRIVDGQHRIKALEELKKRNPDRYNEIKNFEIPVIILKNPSIRDEIETFITINKTAKKVDTSLAFVLKSKIYYKDANIDEYYSKVDYMATEVALYLNENEDNIIYKKISLEGRADKKSEYISLSAFVKILKYLILYIYKKDLFNISLSSDKQLNERISYIYSFMQNYYVNLKKEADYLFLLNEENILLGSIGTNALIRSFTHYLDHKNYDSKYLYKNLDIEFCEFIGSVNFDIQLWKNSGRYSIFSSESGYRHLSSIIINDMKL